MMYSRVDHGAFWPTSTDTEVVDSDSEVWGPLLTVTEESFKQRLELFPECQQDDDFQRQNTQGKQNCAWKPGSLSPRALREVPAGEDVPSQNISITGHTAKEAWL